MSNTEQKLIKALDRAHTDIYFGRLVQCLSDMCAQYLQSGDRQHLHHEFMGAGERSLELLEDLGIVEVVPDRPDYWRFKEVSP